MGFQDWKNINKALKDHESSMDHISSMLKLKKRSSIIDRVDSSLVMAIETEAIYWRKVLKRIVATVKLLATLGVAFRGHRETRESKRIGNFLSCIEYLAEFDNFLKEHLNRFGLQGKGIISYLSHFTYDEFVGLMAANVKDYLISEVKEVIYFSIIVNSTPDITHVDQLTFILRYVDKCGNIQGTFSWLSSFGKS